MTVGELFKILKQNDIPNDAVLMSDCGWECSATDMDEVYYNKSQNTVVFAQDDPYYYNSPDWVLCRK